MTAVEEPLREAFGVAPWLREAVAMRDGATGGGRDVVRRAQAVDRAAPVNLPWCGLFVAHCIRRTRPDLDLPFVQVRARPWLSVGAPTAPRLGAVLVFWIGAPWSPFGHVGFYWGEDDEDFQVIGGNQRDAILVQRWPKARLLDARWPDPLAMPRTGRVRRPRSAAAPEDRGALA